MKTKGCAPSGFAAEEQAMKILIVCGEFFNRSNGLSLSTQRFVKEFRALGQEVRILSSDRGGQPDYAVPVMHLPFVNGIMEKQNFLFAKPEKDVIRQALAWADIVHIEDPFPLSVAVVREAKDMRVPVTGTFHLYPENMTKSVPILDFGLSNRNIMYVFRKVAFRYCAAIQCPTQKVKEKLLKAGYAPKLYVISNGIPTEFIAEQPPEKEKGAFTIISVGRYSAEKDQETLMRAVFLSQYAKDIQLILAGRGPLEEKYRKLGEALPKKPIMGFYEQEELKALEQKAHLYVHCASVEIEGMGCMEAFAGGTVPVIAESELSSTSEYALTPMSRYPAGDAQALAERIDYWYEHRDVLSSMEKQYIELARTLEIRISAEKALRMMRDVLEKEESKNN